jgi:hypothetical protein
LINVPYGAFKKLMKMLLDVRMATRGKLMTIRMCFLISLALVIFTTTPIVKGKEQIKFVYLLIASYYLLVFRLYTNNEISLS